MKPKIIIIGDVHLGRSLNIGKPAVGSSLNSRVSDQFTLLNFTLEQAVEHEVSRIVFTGDVFEDSRPDFNLVNLFVQWLKSVEAEEIAVDIVLGNHEIRRTGTRVISVLDMINLIDFPHITLYKQITTLDLNGISLVLIPFQDRKGLDQDSNKLAVQKLTDILHYELLDCPNSNIKIGVGHLALEGALWVSDEIDDLANEIVCPLSSFYGFDYVWMGHIHKPQILSKKPYLAHVGSMDISDFGETEHVKKLILIDPNDKINFFKEIALPTRNLKKIDLIIPDDQFPTEFVLHHLKSLSLKENIVRITVQLSKNSLEGIDKKKIEKYLYDEQKIHHLVSLTEQKTEITAQIVAASQSTIAIDRSTSPEQALIFFANILKLTEEEAKVFIEMGKEDLEQHNISIQKT